MYNFTLYMTTDCNFKCQYCYEDYHNHYQLNEKTLVDSLEFMMNYGDRGKVLIDFLGGEPLLKKDLIYKAVAYIKDNYPEREVKYYITTNCSMMDDRFIAFMKENHFTVRLSFDGNKETHDLNRAAKDGVSCYEKIFENIMKVKDSGLNFSVRMTVTENTIPYMFENICYLHEHGLDNICMIMDVYLKISDELKVEFEKQVGQILQYYLAEAAAGRVFTIDQFDGKMFNMLCNFGNCFGMCDAGIGNFKIFPNGQIYPCGFLTSNEKYCIGNIKEGVDIRKAKLIAMFGTPEKEQQLINHIEMCQQAGIKVVLSFIYEKTNERELYRLIDIAAKYDVDVLFNIVSSVGRAKENSEILTDMEHLDMNLKIAKYILKQGYENKKIGGAFYQRIQVRNSCGGYGKVMAIFPEGDIYMCQCMEQNQVRMGNILSDEPQKILQELENLLEKDEIKRLFCAEYKEICKECDYRYICGGRCMASEEPYDYRCIFLKAVLNYVLFYYNSKENRRKNLEIYIEYMEEVKRKWKEKANEEEKRAI